MATAAARKPETHDHAAPARASDAVHLPSHSQTWDLAAFTFAVAGSMGFAFLGAIGLMLTNQNAEVLGWTLALGAVVTLLLAVIVGVVGSLYERDSA